MINERYFKGMCASCESDVCKVYGGTCRKYRRHLFFEKIKNFFKVKR